MKPAMTITFKKYKGYDYRKIVTKYGGKKWVLKVNYDRLDEMDFKTEKEIKDFISRELVSCNF